MVSIKYHNQTKRIMKVKDIRNGALYWNTETKRTERVIGKVSPVRVLTYWHGQCEKTYNAGKLRKANTLEVSNYLDGVDISSLKYRLRRMLSRLFSRQKQIA